MQRAMEFFDFESYDSDHTDNNIDVESEDDPQELYFENRRGNNETDQRDKLQPSVVSKSGACRPRGSQQNLQALDALGEQMIKTRVVENYVNIDSRNRDRRIYPDPNNYAIQLDREYTNVKDVRIVSSQIPNVNKNVFSDPLVLRNNCMYWQEFSENCKRIADYEVLDSQKIVVYVDDVCDEILSAIFSNGKDTTDDENTAREFIMAQRAGRNVFDVGLQQVFQVSGTRGYYENYVRVYLDGKVIKVLRNEQICGFYNAVDFRLRFVACGDGLRDCKVLLGVLCAKNTMNARIQVQQSPPTFKVKKPYGFMQTILVGADLNHTFATKSIEVESGLYDDVRLGSELSVRMTKGGSVYRVSINEHKNETRFRTFKRRMLGGQSIMCRMYSADHIRKEKRCFIIMIKYLSHGLFENDEIIIEKYLANVSATSNFEQALKSYIYGRKFPVRTIDARDTGATDARGLTIYEDANIGRFVFFREAVYPIYKNYFYIDLEDNYDNALCRNLFSGADAGGGSADCCGGGYGIGYPAEESYGIGYPAKESDAGIAGREKALSGFGDMIVCTEKIKLVMSGRKYTMDKILGLPPVDSQSTFTKRCRLYKKAFDETGQKVNYYLWCPDHNLVSDDAICLNNKFMVTAKYISENMFLVETDQVLQDLETGDEDAFIFFNIDPVRLLDREFLLRPGDARYTDESMMFFSFANPDIANSFLADFVLRDNIFQCRQYGENCFCAVFSRTTPDGNYVFGIASLEADKIVSCFLGPFAGAQHSNDCVFELTQKNLVCLRYYNHMLLTGVNEVLLSGHLPLDGAHVIYKRDKDHFYIRSKYSCDDWVHKKFAIDTFQLKITSDYHGFTSEVTNQDMFGNAEYDIMFESFPYILCCSKALGGNLANVYFDFDKNSLQNVFCKFNMPEKLVKETKMVFDRHAQTPKTFAQTPLPSLTQIDFSFFYPNGLRYNFQNIEHSMVLLIREYVDYNSDINYSTRRGNTDDINVFQSRRKNDK